MSARASCQGRSAAVSSEASPPTTAAESPKPIRLLSACRATAASSPPVRMVSHPVTSPNTSRSTKPHGVPQPCAAANSAACGSTATHGERRKPPTVCISQPRNTYSSAAAWNGTDTASTASEARNAGSPTHSAGAEGSASAPGSSTDATASSATGGTATARQRASQPQRSRPATDDTVPAGRRPTQRVASRTRGSIKAMNDRSRTVLGSGPKSIEPSGSSGRPDALPTA
ncbi:hypothetical protein SFUMM280S_09358 [Streptomyces fumanus]